MGQVPQPRHHAQRDAARRQHRVHLLGLGWRHRPVLVGGDQREQRPQLRQITQQRAHIPVGHHRHRARHVTGIAHQLRIEGRAGGVEHRSGVADQPLDGARIARLSRDEPGRERQHGHQLRDRWKQHASQSAQRHEGAVDADQGMRRSVTIETHACTQRRAGRVSDDERGPGLQRRQQRLDRLRHAGQRGLPGARHAGVGMPGQIDQQQIEMRLQPRQHRMPRVARRAGAVQQQRQRRGVDPARRVSGAAELLHMPAQAAGVDEATGLAMRPVESVALPDQTGRHRPTRLPSDRR